MSIYPHALGGPDGSIQRPTSGPLFLDLSDRFRVPTTALEEIVYVSRRAPSFSDNDIVNMTVDSAVRNYLAGVSGRLWYSAAYFLQVLEGNQSTIGTFYARIAGDVRHSNVIIVRRRKLKFRRFDRPMHLFQADADATFRDYIDAAGPPDFDGACRWYGDAANRRP